MCLLTDILPIGIAWLNRMYLIETLLIIPPISTFAAPAMFSSFCASFVSSLLVKVICKGVFSAQILGEPEQEKVASLVVDTN